MEDGEVLNPPHRDPVTGKWCVSVTDAVLGVTESRLFSTIGLAQAFYDFVSRSRAGTFEALEHEQQIKHSMDGSVPATSYAQSGRADVRPQGSKRPINMRAVSETLQAYGLDPAAEISGILAPREQVAEDGTSTTVYALDDQTRAKMLLELMQYVHPKLKAVETTVKLDELTEEQVDAKLAALFSKVAKDA